MAAQSLITVFDLKNTKVTIAQLQSLQAKAKYLPAELQENLIQTLLKEKADILETINDAKPIRLANIEMHGDMHFKISPDSKYVCYVAQKRLAHNERCKPDTLVLIHLPTGKKDLIVDTSSSAFTFTFSPDSSRVIFDKSQRYAYDIARKQTTLCMQNDQSIDDGNKEKITSPSGSQVAGFRHNTVILKDTATGALKRIAYLDKITYVSFADENTLLVGIHKLYNDRFDLLRTDIATQKYLRVAKDLGVLDCNRCLSIDAMLYIGMQTISNKNRHCLLHCDKQTCIKEYSKEELLWLNYAFTPDAAAVIVKGCIPSDNRYYPYLYHTHRAITNNASLDELLALLIAERQRLNNSSIDLGTFIMLSTSRSTRLADIAKARYASFKPV